MLEKYNIKEYGFYVAVVTFFAFQVILADYGYRVDQFDYIESFDVSSDNLGGALKRDAITGIDAIYSENLNKWMMRFKLYSVDSDEVTNIMALARIRPSELEFDPHFYAYGGGYLYPLGGWFFFLEQLGWIEIGSLESMLNSPDRMDRVYYAGRIFVLISFALSALVLFYVLRSIQSNSFAMLGVLIYMIIPVLVMFSITMKPHVYGMFWSNLALWVLVNAGNRGELTKKHVLGVGIVLGVAVGSASTYSLFAVLIWSGLAYYVWRGLVQPYALIMVPFIAVCAYVLTNPYVFINYDAYLQEVEKVQSWFYWDAALVGLWDFIENSMIPGFGYAFSVLTAYVLWKGIASPSLPGVRVISIVMILIILAVSVISSPLSHMHINARYIFYFIPIVFVVYAFHCGQRGEVVLGVVVVLTLVHTVPIFMAYMDEDDSQFSTRLNSAKWINQNILDGSSICYGNMAPYDTPPFDFGKYDVNKDRCDYSVFIERESDYDYESFYARNDMILLKRFTPRINIGFVPLVYSHVNPQISIYKSIYLR